MAQASHELNMEDATKVLEAVIREECKILNDGKDCKDGEIINLMPIPNWDRYQNCYVSDQQIKKIITDLGYDQSFLDELVKRGLLLRFVDSQGNPVYRSVYMDLFIRSVNLRNAEWSFNYILKPRLVLIKSSVPFSSDRIYRISMNSNVKEIRNLIDLLRREIGEEKAKKFVEIMNAYLDIKGYNGFDLVQVEMIREAIEAYVKGKHIGIEAPTGFGKTEIFLFLILFVLMKNDFNPNKRILILYPRKSLAIDNTNRLIVLAKLIEEKLGKVVPILIRIGDSMNCKWEENPSNDDKPRGGNLRCPKGHELVFRNKERACHEPGLTCSNTSCEYSRQMFYIYDTNAYKRLIDHEPEPLIIISNMNTIANRLLDFKNRDDLDVEDFKRIDIIIMDEAHVYTSIFGGVTSAVLEGIKKINPHIRFVGVSATIPNREEFLAELFSLPVGKDGMPQDLAIVSSLDIVNNNKVSSPLKGFKLYLLGFFEIRPDASWQGYAQLWSIVASTYSIAHLNQTVSGPYTFQNIVFINNVLELNRFRDGFQQYLGIGEPCGKNPTANRNSTNKLNRITDDYELSRINTFYILIDRNKLFNLCSPLNNSKYSSKISELLATRSGIVFMDSASKYEAFKKIKEGEWITVGATSSLELGVDYEGVSFILNAGADDEIEIVQRLGRAARSSKIPRIAVGIIVSKNVPLHSYRINDINYIGRIIYMLSGRRISSNQRTDLDIHVASEVRPVITFRKLLISALEAYNHGKLVNEVKQNIITVLSQIPDEINLIERIKDLIESEDYSKCIEYQSSIENELLRYRQFMEFFSEGFIDELNRIRREWNKTYAELAEKLSEFNGVGNKVDLSSDELNERKEEIDNLLRNVNLIFRDLKEILEKNMNTNVTSEFKEKTDSVVNNLEKIRESIENIQRKIQGYIGTKEIFEKLGRLTYDIYKLTNDLKNYMNDYVSDPDRYKNKEDEEKIKLANLICKTLKSKYDLRSFIFDFSSISSAGLDIEDSFSPKVTLKIYEFGENGPEVVGRKEEEGVFKLLAKYPPFYVFNYSWLVERRTNPNVPRFAVILPSLNLNLMKWNGQSDFISFIDESDSPIIGSRIEEIDVRKISEIRAFDLLSLQKHKLKGNYLIVQLKPGRQRYYDDVYRLKLGVDERREVDGKQYDILDYLLKGYNDKLQTLANRLRINYDVTVLSYVRTCLAGHGLSTDLFDVKCPFENKCEIKQSMQGQINCGDRWSYPSANLMHKPWLDFDYKFAFENESRTRLTPLVEMSKVDSLTVERTLGRVLIYIGDYARPLYLNPKIKQILYNTNAIRIKLDKDIAIKILEDILFKGGNTKLFNIILTKYYIFKNGEFNLYKGIMKLAGDLWRNNSKSQYVKLMTDILQNSKIRQEFLEFAYAVLMHTLAHAIYDFLLDKLKLDEDLIDYYYDFNLENIQDSIYIYEKTTFGVLKLSDLILSKFGNFNKLMTDFLEFILKEIVDEHNKFIQYTKSALQSLRKIIQSNQNSSEFRALVAMDSLLNNMRQRGIEPDREILKLLLSPTRDFVPLPQGINKMIAEDIADVALGDFCVDGCSSCVLIDNCHYPLNQNIITSRNLLEEFVKYISNYTKMDLGYNVILKTSFTFKGDSDFGFSILRSLAEREDAVRLNIEVAYIDGNCLTVIEDILKQNPKIKVTIKLDSRDKEKVNTLRQLIEKLKNTGRFNLEIVNDIHTKLYEIVYEDGRKIMISGSWNCEKSQKEQNFTIHV